MKRRRFLAGLAVGVGSAAISRAQQAPSRTFRLGILSTGTPTPYVESFVATLRELGYVENRNLTIERRFAEGNIERLAAFASELVSRRVDVILAIAAPAALAAKQATTTIPIVFPSQTDPVKLGLVTSLARPGGNITGTSLMAADLSAKRLELLRALSPNISRIAMLWDSSNPGMAERVKATQSAAEQSHVLLQTVGPRTVQELEAALANLVQQRPDALLVTVEPFTRRNLPRILEFCSANRIPCMFEERSFVEAGGLISYGPDPFEFYRRAAVYVDKIFRGTKPADLPIEQPTTFDLVVNVKTAKALGLRIPSDVLLRANRVVE